MLKFVNIPGTASKQPQIKKIGSIKRIVLTADFLKYFTRTFQRKHISQSKRNLPDSIQKCAEELI